jgi:TetR/AcrR family transcriptional regulator, fatty acid metabolism regulator protein
MGNFVESIESKIEGFCTAPEKLLFMVESYFKMLANDHYLARVTQLELRQSNMELRLKINKVLKSYFMVVDQILQEGIEKGEFPETLDVRLARQMVFGTIDEIVTTWVMSEQKYDLIALAPKVQQLMLNGCGKHGQVSPNK